jgi:hypothetical protein
MLSTKLKEAAGNGADANPYVDDVFSTWLYTGNGSTQTITNGIDLAGKGGLVWTKARSAAYDHILVDTVRGRPNSLHSNTTQAQLTRSDISSFNSDGYSLGLNQGYENNSGINYASWTFREATKFFDIVTWTHTGTNGRVINHSLGSTVGMIIVKNITNGGSWAVWHRSAGTGQSGLYLQKSDAFGATDEVTSVGSTTFTLSNSFDCNGDTGATGVAYLFAHDTSSTGIIQCGSFTKTASYPDSAPVVLGYEPQFILFKRIDSGTTENWNIGDIIRGDGNWGGLGAGLSPNLATSETSTLQFRALPTGFTIGNSTSIGGTYIYIAIRRSNKPPTSGTQVFAPVLYTGNETTNKQIGSSVTTDMLIIANRDGVATNLVSYSRPLFDRMRGSDLMLRTSYTNADDNNWRTYVNLDNQFGWDTGTGTSFQNYLNKSGATYVSYLFKRAPGFFDVVCYTGTGAGNTPGRLQNHNLTVAPELIITKKRSAVSDWIVTAYSALGSLGSRNWCDFTTSDAFTATASWATEAPTSTQYNVGGALDSASATFVTYLFATLAGISKVGSYTGNGTGQAIACGFSAGARFVLIKRTDAAGAWYTFDSARGLTVGSSPYLLLNISTAETTGNNGVYASTGGFTLGATAITTTNIASATYIFLSVA